jgi:uncharacterized membrane-anchored protein YitT (DUF2179 family)
MSKLSALTFCCAVVAAFVSIAGCAMTASVSTLQPIEDNLGQYKKAIVVVGAAPEVQGRDGASYVQSRIKFSMLDKLRASKKFQDVTDQPPSEPSDSDLKIVVTVTGVGSRSSGYLGSSIGLGVGGGSGGGFFGMGVGAPLTGSGSTGGLSIQVELLDAKRGKRLGYMDANATSGDSGAQAEAIAEKVVAKIMRK